jgi:hypothetical protein
MRTPQTRGYSRVGFWPDSIGGEVNIFNRSSCIISAGLFFDGSFVCDAGVKRGRTFTFDICSNFSAPGKNAVGPACPGNAF